MKFRQHARLLLPIVALAFAASLPVSGRAASSTPGTNAHEQNLFELVGEVATLQNMSGFAITHVGYVTHYLGLPDSALFTNSTTRNETTAVLTYSSTTQSGVPFTIGSTIATASSTGGFTFY